MDTGEQAAEESSANRRERLLALRSAAAAAGSSSSSSPSAAPPPLQPPAWDLPEPDLTPSSAPRPPARFGFYTNPGAAFSSAAAPNKRKSPDTLLSPSPAPAPPHGRSGNYGNSYPPHQRHMAPSQMEPAPPGTGPWRSPMQFQTPMSEYGGAPPGPPPHWNPHSTSPAQDYYPRSPNLGFRGSNVGRGGNPMNYGPRGSPVNYGPRGSPMNYTPRGTPMNYEPRGSPMNYEPRGSLMNYGPRGSPCSSSGRGRGENYYSGPDSRGRGGRGGSGFQNHSGGQGQMNYYYKSMVDDPWKNLRPIVGSILPTDGGGAKPWHQEPFRTKIDNKPDQGRVISTNKPDQGQVISTSTSGLSLAEYLDLSFNEVSNET